MSKELDNGFTAEYWKITKIEFNSINETSIVELSLFKDQVARDAGKERILFKSFSWNSNDFPFTVSALDADNPYVIAYAKIVIYNEFNSAINV